RHMIVCKRHFVNREATTYMVSMKRSLFGALLALAAGIALSPFVWQSAHAGKNDVQTYQQFCEVFELTGGQPTERVSQGLNPRAKQLGAEGWELVSVAVAG